MVSFNLIIRIGKYWLTESPSMWWEDLTSQCLGGATPEIGKGSDLTNQMLLAFPYHA